MTDTCKPSQEEASTTPAQVQVQGTGAMVDASQKKAASPSQGGNKPEVQEFADDDEQTPTIPLGQPGLTGEGYLPEELLETSQETGPTTTTATKNKTTLVIDDDDEDENADDHSISPSPADDHSISPSPAAGGKDDSENENEEEDEEEEREDEVVEVAVPSTFAVRISVAPKRGEALENISERIRLGWTSSLAGRASRVVQDGEVTHEDTEEDAEEEAEEEGAEEDNAEEENDEEENAEEEKAEEEQDGEEVKGEEEEEEDEDNEEEEEEDNDDHGEGSSAAMGSRPLRGYKAKPCFVQMIIEALNAYRQDDRGITPTLIKAWISLMYDVDNLTMKAQFKSALEYGRTVEKIFNYRKTEGEQKEDEGDEEVEDEEGDEEGDEEENKEEEEEPEYQPGKKTYKNSKGKAVSKKAAPAPNKKGKGAPTKTVTVTKVPPKTGTRKSSRNASAKKDSASSSSKKGTTAKTAAARKTPAPKKTSGSTKPMALPATSNATTKTTTKKTASSSASIQQQEKSQNLLRDVGAVTRSLKRKADEIAESEETEQGPPSKNLRSRGVAAGVSKSRKL
ncbi:hypothetical protein BGX24_007853, partial [Mortierella sp. AD032]